MLIILTVILCFNVDLDFAVISICWLFYRSFFNNSNHFLTLHFPRNARYDFIENFQEIKIGPEISFDLCLCKYVCICALRFYRIIYRGLRIRKKDSWLVCCQLGKLLNLSVKFISGFLSAFLLNIKSLPDIWNWTLIFHTMKLQ